MMEYRIVRLERSMLPQVAELEKECFSEPWSESSLELLLGGQGVGLAALCGGRVVAYVGMLCVLDEGQITNLAVRSEHRRRGLGRALMSSLEELAAEKGASLLSLEVRESNVAARGLYRAMGWQEEGVRKGFYKLPLENAIVMTKSL